MREGERAVTGSPRSAHQSFRAPQLRPELSPVSLPAPFVQRFCGFRLHSTGHHQLSSILLFLFGIESEEMRRHLEKKKSQEKLPCFNAGETSTRG